MPSPTIPRFIQALRYTTHRATSIRGPGDRVGSFAAVGYCAAVISTPFAGAYLVGQAVDGDQRYASRTLSFRDCLPGSRLEDYSGALLMRMRNP